MCKLSHFYAGKLSPCPPSLLLCYLRPGDQVAEIGCGCGVLLAELSKRGFPAVGVEPDAARVRQCRAAGLRAFEGAAEALPLEDACCDCAILECVYSLCEPVKTHRELSRILRPNGTLLLADLFATQALCADATHSPLIGRISTRTQMEEAFLPDFQLTEFCDLTHELHQYLLQQMLCGGDCALSAEERTILRSVKPGYGLWIWMKR